MSAKAPITLIIDGRQPRVTRPFCESPRTVLKVSRPLVYPNPLARWHKPLFLRVLPDHDAEVKGKHDRLACDPNGMDVQAWYAYVIATLRRGLLRKRPHLAQQRVLQGVCQRIAEQDPHPPHSLGRAREG